MTNTMAIKKFFGMTASEAMKEIKALSKDERAEIGALCAAEIGETIDAE